MTKPPPRTPCADGYLVDTYPMPDGIECCWCGNDHTEKADGQPYRNREGEPFCSINHRTASTRALHKLQQRWQQGAEKATKP